MLCVGRQARTAYRFGPTQNRRTSAGEELRSTWTTTLFAWMDIQGDSHAYGATCERALDAAYTRNANWRNTAASSTYPLSTVDSNIKCYQYDGVNDYMPTTNTLTLTVKTITVVTLYRNFSPANGALSHYNSNWVNQTASWFVGGSTTSCLSGSKGNVGISSRTWASAQNVWRANASVYDRTQGVAANQIRVYEDSALLTVFTASADALNTSDFGTFVCSTAYNPYASSLVAGMLIFTKALTSAQIAQVTQLFRWRAGFSA